MHPDRFDGKNLQLEGALAFGLVLLVTVLVRIYLFLYTPVIARDATLYITQAQLMAQGILHPLLAVYFEPLFPFSIFLLHLVVPDWELAGKLASMAFGILATIPFFLISRDTFGPRPAFGAGILLALHPYFARNSVDALTESAYLFFFLLSVWLALRALRTTRLRWYLLCAITILLTRLVRTEGIWLFPAISLFLLLRSLGDLRRGQWVGAVPLARFSLAFLMVMIPMSVYGIQFGHPSELSAPKGLGRLVSFLPQVPAILQASLARLNSVEAGVRALAHLWEDYFSKLLRTFHPVLLFLVLPPLLQRASRRQHWDYFLLTSSIALIYLGGVYLTWLVLGRGYTAHRYMMAPVAVGLPWAAVTIELAANRLERSGLAERWRTYLWQWSGRRGQKSQDRFGWGTILLVVIALILAAKTVKPQRLDLLPIKEAGAWIAARQWKDPVIIAADSRIAFYAKGRMLPVSNDLRNKTTDEQLSLVRNLLSQATLQKAQFIFLNGNLDRETQVLILTSESVNQILEWSNSHGKVYTLIQVKGSEK